MDNCMQYDSCCDWSVRRGDGNSQAEYFGTDSDTRIADRSGIDFESDARSEIVEFNHPAGFGHPRHVGDVQKIRRVIDCENCSVIFQVFISDINHMTCKEFVPCVLIQVFVMVQQGRQVLKLNGPIKELTIGEGSTDLFAKV